MKIRNLLLCFIILCAAVFSVNGTYKAFANEPPEWDYEQDFSSAEAVNADFKAYYLTKFMGILTAEPVSDGVKAGSHWNVSGGALSRTGDIDGLNADCISMLTLTKKKYTNFKMRVDIRQGSQTAFWGAFCVRQDQPGKMFFEDGAGVYLEQEGNIRIWGYALPDGPYLCGKVNNYSKSEWYTYDVTVDGNLITLSVGGTQTTVRVPWSYYREGYLTFMAINNNSAFRNLKIKELPDCAVIGKDVPAGQSVTESNTEDSLSNLAQNENQNGAVKDSVVKEKPEQPDIKGCGAVSGKDSTIGGLSVLFAAFVLTALRFIFVRSKPKSKRRDYGKV